MTYGQRIFADYKKQEFRYFEWSNDSKNGVIVDELIKSNFKLQVDNDNTKGNTATKLISYLADGNFEPILGYAKCPRCSCRFHQPPTKFKLTADLPTLSFKDVDHLSSKDKLNFLTKKVKALYNNG